MHRESPLPATTNREDRVGFFATKHCLSSVLTLFNQIACSSKFVPNSFQIGLPYLENRLRAVYSLPPCWIFVACEFEIERESHVVILYFSC